MGKIRPKYVILLSMLVSIIIFPLMSFAGVIRTIDLELDPAGDPAGDPYFTGDYLHDNGNLFYVSTSGVGGAPTIKWLGSLARKGDQVLNFYLPVDLGSERTRSEVATTPDITFGTQFYHGFSIYVPYSGFPAPTSWEAFNQYWQHPDIGPPLALEFVANSDPLQYRVVYRNDAGFHEIYRANMPRGQWIDFIVQANFSTSASGYFEVWQNYNVAGNYTYKRVAKYTGQLGVSGKGSTIKAKIGLYREAGQTIAQSVFFDQIKYGTTFDDADPNK